MSEPIQIIAVKKPNRQPKNTLQKYDPTDIDLVVDMVNDTYRQQESERRAKASRERLRVLKQREADVFRREQAIRRKEEQYRYMNRLIRRFIDAALLGFSLLGMATALWFWRTVIGG